MSETSTKKEKRIIKIKSEIIKAFDENGNGKIDIEDVLIKCMRMPGVKIDREKFLRKEFEGKLSKEVIDKAIVENPMKAHINSEFIDKVANSVINIEKISASGISAVLSSPVAVTMPISSITFDIVQYYSLLLVVMQKLLYLYGYPQLDLDYEGKLLDSESMRVVIACLGVMFGVGTANKLIHKLSPGLAQGVAKTFMKTAVTKKTVWYPALKNICKLFDYSLTKAAVKNVMGIVIPVVGIAIGGTITYISFGTSCKKLQKQLKNTIFSNPDYVEPVDEDIDLDEDITIEVDEEDVELTKSVINEE